METWWVGPGRVVARVGESSYKVLHKPGEIWEVHRDWLKPWVMDQLMGTNMPLYYHRGTTKSTVVKEGEEEVKAILKHRMRDGKIEFLTRWAGIPH